MASFLRQIAYLASWQLRSWFGRRAPLQSVIFILDQCNLRCRHCSVYALTNPRIKTLAQIRAELEYCYGLGARFVDFEGGELYLWKDKQGDRIYTIDDVVDLAHEVGFWNVTITTNAQLPFDGSHADHIWVSMDGIGDWHDDIRGKGTFARLEQNIARYKMSNDKCQMTNDKCQISNRKSMICVNLVLNNRNYPCLDETLEYVKNSPYIDSISVNFHTPFSETENLYLDPVIRNGLIDRLITYKRRGYPIVNTVSGLKAMRVINGKTACTNRSCWITNFIFSDGSKAPKCMGYTHDVCDRCGFSMGGEMRALWLLKPDTLLAGMKLRITANEHS